MHIRILYMLIITTTMNSICQIIYPVWRKWLSSWLWSVVMLLLWALQMRSSNTWSLVILLFRMIFCYHYSTHLRSRRSKSAASFTSLCLHMKPVISLLVSSSRELTSPRPTPPIIPQPHRTKPKPQHCIYPRGWVSNTPLTSDMKLLILPSILKIRKILLLIWLKSSELSLFH